MKLRFSLSIVLVVLWGLLLGLPERAYAARSAAVLGVRSLDGEDDLERRVSHALRTNAGTIGDLSVSDRLVSLEQMILSHGCEDADAACLKQIAQTLSAELLLYGSVVLAHGSHELTLHTYDARSGRIETATARALSAQQLVPGVLDEVVRKLLRQVLGIAVNAKLRIAGNRPGAAVSVDGAPRGVLDAQGGLELELPAGQHVVRVTEPDVPESTRTPVAEERMLTLGAGDSERLVLTLPAAPVVSQPQAAAQPSEPAPPPPPKRKRSWRRILGWTSVGVGAALAAATVYTWVRLGNINDDADYTAYRQQYPRGSTGANDICRAAARGELAARDPSKAGLEKTADDLCSEGDKLEALQYVFLSGALLGVGGGTYLLLTAPKHEEAPRASLRPRFDRASAVLEASFRF